MLKVKDVFGFNWPQKLLSDHHLKQLSENIWGIQEEADVKYRLLSNKKGVDGKKNEYFENHCKKKWQ